jgi:hypothetical protein
MKLLSLNLALRPQELQVLECKCEPEYHLMNANAGRVHAFLKKLPSLNIDILCFQELMDYPLVEVLCGKLEQMGYSTHENIDPRNPKNQGQPKQHVAPSGLAIFVRDKALFEIVSGHQQTFENRIGVDVLALKGFMWLICKHKLFQTEFVVMTLHPQAYCKLSSTSPPCEGKEVSFLRQQVLMQVEKMGGWAAAIESTHIKQFTQIQNTIIKEKLNTKPIFLLGDFNVNSYFPEPFSPEEQEKDNYLEEQKGVGREWKHLLENQLKGFEPLKNRGEPYSWNGGANWFAKGIGADKPVYQKIDHCLLYQPKTKIFLAEEQILPISCMVPELSPFWLPECVQNRKATYPGVYEYSQQMEKRGFIQCYNALKSFLKKHKVVMEKKHIKTVENLREILNILQQKPKTWEAWLSFVKELPSGVSVQLWKGRVYETIKDESLKSYLQTLKNGSPHPFRMMNQVSDHAALFVNVVLF